MKSPMQRMYRFQGYLNRKMRTRLILAALVSLSVTACDVADVAKPLSPDSELTLVTSGTDFPGWVDAREVLEKRCVVCHGCYDAPCQLKLSSIAGLRRGAFPVQLYDTGRLTDTEPTRLHVDAQSEAQWRQMGFYPVLPTRARPEPSDSLLLRLVELARTRDLKPDAALPQTLGLRTEGNNICPAPEQIGAFANDHPRAGMPYAMATLPDDEYRTLRDWLLGGAPMPRYDRVELSGAESRQVVVWEEFFNRPGWREQLVARFLYEHLFLAHLHFEHDRQGAFFRIVRSSTPPGEAIREIATRRPFDSPGDSFFYRLKPVVDTILHKDHILYRLGPDRMSRWETLFLGTAWTTGAMPPYGEERGSNPFITFADIPAESRYRFLLDDALFFVRSFIRGPVCHGQVATDVVEDHFWVAFLAPPADLSLTDPGFLTEAAPLLRLPVERANEDFLGRLWPVFHDGHQEWLRFRDSRYAASAIGRLGFDREDIWSDGGFSGDAFLTVFRNHDNATVVRGLVGDIPETAWVIDFPVFERIYYDLVAGYDVFGSIEHQLTTRLYMDHLRREGEDLFLSFLPPSQRKPLHDEWYRGPLAEFHASWTERRTFDVRPVRIDYATDDPKAELLRSMIGELPRAQRQDVVNRCSKPECRFPSGAHRELARLAGRTGDWVRFLPEVTLVVVEHASGRPELFTLMNDRAHTNVALLFGEGLRREPEKDTITVLEGSIGSFPNFILRADGKDLAAMVSAILRVRDEAGWIVVADRFGVRRMSSDFWQTIDLVHEEAARISPLDAGLLDLNRYVDPSMPAAARGDSEIK